MTEYMMKSSSVRTFPLETNYEDPLKNIIPLLMAIKATAPITCIINNADHCVHSHPSFDHPLGFSQCKIFLVL